MKRILSLIFAIFLANMVKAQVVQHLFLNNGSVLNGYVEKSGGGVLTFHSDNATIIINNADVENISREMSASDLPKVWADWAEANDAYEGIGNQRTLRLSSIRIKSLKKETAKDSLNKKVFEQKILQKGEISNVKVLETGTRLRYLELNPNTYQMSWDDVAVIKTDRRPKTVLSGIDCTYQLESGESYTGQVGDETKNTLGLYLKGGEMKSFDINKVVKYTYRANNPHQNIFEQSELLDVVSTNNGEVVRGIVVEQNYTGKSDDENYLLVQINENGEERKVKMSDYVSRRKENNPKYNPLTDVLLAEDEVMVNRQKGNFVGVKEVDEQLVLDSITNSISVNSSNTGGTKLVVEYCLPGTGNNAEVYQLVKVRVLSEKKKVKTYGFTYKDLANFVIRAYNVETSVNGTTKAEYVVGGAGNYALYDSKKKRAIPVTITL